jgi:hypothetical protein
VIKKKYAEKGPKLILSNRPRTASNSTKTCSSPAGDHENELKNLTLVNILILVVLLIVLLANAREGQ